MTDRLDIVFQDDHLVAINKPSGLLVHRSDIDKHETRFAVQLLRDQLQQRVFPVHRLDKPTSGVLLFGLTTEAAQRMGQLFSTHQLRKTYIAVVRGHCAGEGLIDHPLREDPDFRDRNHQVSAQAARTHYRHLADVELPFMVDRYATSRYSLVQCEPLTGRKHQIRRHLKHLSHPIIGDAKHGKGIHNRFFQHQFGVSRLLLAATELEFIHPFTAATVQISAPLDGAFYRLLRRFRWHNAIPPRWQAEALASFPEHSSDRNP